MPDCKLICVCIRASWGRFFRVNTSPSSPTRAHSRSNRSPFGPRGHSSCLHPPQDLIGYTQIPFSSAETLGRLGAGTGTLGGWVSRKLFCRNSSAASTSALEDERPKEIRTAPVGRPLTMSLSSQQTLPASKFSWAKEARSSCIWLSNICTANACRWADEFDFRWIFCNQWCTTQFSWC